MKVLDISFDIGVTAREKIYSILMGIFWCSNLAFYLVPVFTRLGAENGHNAVPVFLLLMSVLCVGIWKKQFRFSDILLYLSFVAIFYGSVLFYPDTAKFIDEANDRIMIQSLPYLFFGLIFCYYKCFNALHLISLIAIGCNVLFFYLMTGMSTYKGELEDENMNAAYMLIPAMMVVTYHMLDEKKMIDIVALAVGVLLLMFMGTRGPLVIYVFFVALYIVFFTKTKHPKLVKTVAALFATVFYWFSDAIAMALMVVSSSLGMSTRVFESMLEDNMIGMNASNGRDEIAADLMNHLIEANPWGGFGLGSDKVYNGFFYSHNVIVEILFSFGFLVGGVMLVALGVLIYKAFMRCTSREERLFLLALFCSGFLKVCFSSRFVWEPHFYMLIGVCISIVRKYKDSNGIIK